MSQRATKHRCVVCKGKIIETKTLAGGYFILTAKSKPLPTVSSYHCGDCGILYAYPPKDEAIKRLAQKNTPKHVRNRTY